MSEANKPRVSEQVRNHWKSTLVQLGVNERVLNGEHHPCPVTGEGDDRFRFSNYQGKGNFFCACNDGKSDGFKLLECMFGMDFKTAARAVEGVIGEADPDDARDRNPEMALADLRMIQSRVQASTTDEHVRRYLINRGIPADRFPAGALQQAHLNYGLRKINITKPWDAMVAKVTAPAGLPSTFHLTYLKDGQKATHERSRVVATPAITMTGGAVRLHRMGPDGTLGVAEGIETALSAGVLFKVPAWATLNAQMLEQFEPPKDCKRLLIFADNDASFTGQAAAYLLAKRCRLKWKVDAEVHIPPQAGQDWNDILQQRGAE